MAVERITISLESELAAQLRDAADDDRTNVSAWVADALRRALNSRGLLGVIREWEAEHGAFTEEELESARRELGP